MISRECALTPEEKPEPSQAAPGPRENFRPHISFIGQAQMGVNPPKKCSENPRARGYPPPPPSSLPLATLGNGLSDQGI